MARGGRKSIYSDDGFESLVSALTKHKNIASESDARKIALQWYLHHRHLDFERGQREAVDQSATLIDSIEPDKWAAWDASNENPMVVDSDGIDDPDHDEGKGQR